MTARTHAGNCGTAARTIGRFTNTGYLCLERHLVLPRLVGPVIVIQLIVVEPVQIVFQHGSITRCQPLIIG